MPTIYLIRHGETPLNAARVIQYPETPLSARGIEQARRLAERLRSHPVERVMASDHKRALMTAEPLLAVTGAPLEVRANLGERDFGELRGRAHAELPHDMRTGDFDPPGGESPAVFAARVDQAWGEVLSIVEGHGRPTAVVTHGLVCRRLADRHLGLPEGWQEDPPAWHNTSLTILEGPPWRTTLLACVAHLDEALEGGAA